MFRKKVELGTENLVSGKVKKKLLSGLPESCSVLFDKSTPLKLQKLTNSKALLYLTQLESTWVPVLIDTGSAQVLPSIYAVWEHPELLPKVETHSQVSQFLLNGADLMWPGVTNKQEVLSWFKPGLPVAVQIRGNPSPVGVGVLSELPTSEMTGVCVKVANAYRDGLWLAWQEVPNEGYGVDIVVPLEEEPQETPEETPEEAPEESKEPLEMTEDMVMSILLTALKVGVTELPLEPSQLQKTMQMCKRDLPFNLKNSPFKKIGKLMEHASELELIKYEQPKGFDHKLVTAVNSSHPMIAQFRPLVNKPKPLPQETESEPTDYPKVVYHSVLIPTSAIKPFLQKALESTPQFVEKPETNKILMEYIKANQLDQNVSAKQMSRVDELLAQALKIPSEEHQKSDLVRKFQGSFKEGYIKEYTLGMFEPSLKHGSIPSIEIKVERLKGRKNKTVTIVKGCEHYEIDYKELGQACRKMLAASATVEQVKKDSKTVNVLHVQGNHSAEVSKFIITNYQVPKSSLQINNLKK